MSDTIKEVYAVFGDALPTRSDYSATAAKPFPATTIMKEFKTWAKFELAYRQFAISKRNEKAAKSVVTKPAKKADVVKKEVKNDGSEE